MMLRTKFVKYRIIEWAVAIVFAPKEKSSLQFSVNYRKLHAATSQDGSSYIGNICRH